MMNTPIQPPPLGNDEVRHAFSLLEQVSQRSRIRAIAEHIVANVTPSVTAFAELQQALVSPNQYHWRESRLAAWCLSHIPLLPHQRTAAIQTLADVIRKRYNPSLRSIVARSAFISLVIGTITLNPVGLLVLAILSYPLVHLFVWDAARSHAAQIRGEAARSLQTLQAVETLDLLTVAAVNDMLFVRIQARTALCHLLPLLTSAHYGMLRPSTLQLLSHLLNAPNELLVQRILEAFAKVGTRSVLSSVKLIARGRGKYGHLPHIRQAAFEAQMRIEERLRREQETRVLLRASQVEPVMPEQLLRPAMDAHLERPEELLRASQSGAPLDSDIALAIIEDIKRRNDPRAIPFLKDLLRLPSLPQAVAAAAHECLALLQARAELDRAVPPALSPDVEAKLFQTDRPPQAF
ncbi:MAG TPA: hypothetical protein VKV29_03885 [Chthonomonas sp.]|uniref:hypothetical protein n=1 Tax=Chthonomonas sp. TaxID=2282153 RepID=UPI002B4ABF7F|nr:hypothetical protein [Chthonomonas sp.]HLH79405.1 hypothetical protein [Chthonomonas sp.]